MSYPFSIEAVPGPFQSVCEPVFHVFTAAIGPTNCLKRASNYLTNKQQDLRGHIIQSYGGGTSVHGETRKISRASFGG